MIKDKIFKEHKYKQFLIPLGIILFAYIIIAIVAVNNRIEITKENYKEQSLALAESYSKRLTRSEETRIIVNELINEKIAIISELPDMYVELENEDLKSVIEKYSLAKVSLFDNDGNHKRSIYSGSIDISLEEKTSINSLVLNTINEKGSYFQGLAFDDSSQEYYKIGFYKLRNEEIIELVVNLNGIKEHLEKIEMHNLLNVIKNNDNIQEVSFIDNDFIVISSTDATLEKTRIEDEQLIKSIVSNQFSSKESIDYNNNFLDICAPIYFGSERLGTLLITYSLNSITDEISGIIIYGIIVLLSFTFVFFLVHQNIYKRSKRLLKKAYFDRITKKPNFTYYEEYMSKKLDAKESMSLAIMMVNIKQFRIANLLFGFKVGDKLLDDISNSIEEALTANEKIFRSHADKFIVVIEDYPNKTYLNDLAGKIITKIKYEIYNTKHNKTMDAKVGIVEVKERHENPKDLIEEVTYVLDLIEKKYKPYLFFNDDMLAQLEREENILEEIRKKINNHQKNNIFLVYQPQVEAKTGNIVGFEALARLNSKKVGQVSPIEFIELAEDNNLIIELGNMLLEEACIFMKKLNNLGFYDIKIAVNVSPLQLLLTNFHTTVGEVIKKVGIDPDKIEIEITESSIINDSSEAINTLNELAKTGVTIALDDFGTKFSSLDRLESLPFNSIKIDKSFIRRITDEKCEHSIVSDIISMSHKIKLKVVAEGVENTKQRDYVLNHECDIIQGYLYSKPLSKDEAISLLQTNRTIEV